MLNSFCFRAKQYKDNCLVISIISLQQYAIDFIECSYPGNRSEKCKDRKGDKLSLFKNMVVYIENGKKITDK